MKIFKVEYLLRGKSHALRIEGANTIPDAVQVAEAVLNTVFRLGVYIRGAFEVYK